MARTAVFVLVLGCCVCVARVQTEDRVDDEIDDCNRRDDASWWYDRFIVHAITIVLDVVVVQHKPRVPVVTIDTTTKHSNGTGFLVQLLLLPPR